LIIEFAYRASEARAVCHRKEEIYPIAVRA
jgi:hypothetical protein